MCIYRYTFYLYFVYLYIDLYFNSLLNGVFFINNGFLYNFYRYFNIYKFFCVYLNSFFNCILYI